MKTQYLLPIFLVWFIGKVAVCQPNPTYTTLGFDNNLLASARLHHPAKIGQPNQITSDCPADAIPYIESTSYSDSLESDQKLTMEKVRMFRIWIKKDGKDLLPYPMYLYAVNDSSLTLVKPDKKETILSGTYNSLTVNVKDIDVIEVQRKGTAATYAVGGGLSGMLISLLYLGTEDITKDMATLMTLGFYEEPERPAGEKAFIVGASTLFGAGIGAAIGSKAGKHKIPINRNQINFNMNQKYLKDRAIIK